MVVKDGVKALVGVENVQVGDLIEVKPGEKIVIDGVVTSGEGSFDESSLTGENEPIYKQKEDSILSGSLCLDSVLRLQSKQRCFHSLLTSIVSLLEESITKKPHIEQLANTISGYFSVIILLIAILYICRMVYAGWKF